jgi:hypothetical protein
MKQRFRHRYLQTYQQRWDVEEDYKVMKSRLNIENFSGVSVEAVLQDIHAKTLTKNLASIAITEAKKVKSNVRKCKYKINVTYAFRQLKDNVVRLLMCISNDGLSRLMIEKTSQVTNAYRPDRKFDRPYVRMSVDKYSIAYKRLC